MTDFAAPYRRFLHCWRPLFLTAAAWKIVGLLVLSPLVGVLFRQLLTFSGETALADEDILFFFLSSPWGWACLVIIGAVAGGLLALEQTALLGILGAMEQGVRVSTGAALGFALSHAARVLNLTARIMVRVLAMGAPFLLAGFAAYRLLLSEFDINYYLAERPPEFFLALVIAAVLGLALGLLALRWASSWLFALPMVVFEGVAPGQALAASTRRASGYRLDLIQSVALWGVGILLVSSVTTLLVNTVGRLLITDWSGTLAVMTALVGLVLLVWTLVALLVNMLGTTTFAALLFQSWRDCESPRSTPWVAADSIRLGGRQVSLEITRRRLAGGLLLAVVVAGVVGYRALATISVNEDVQVIAHRGASAAAPENTMAAVELAMTQGTDWVEIDVQETAEDEVVVFHDSDFKKTAGSALRIWEATSADLVDLDIGSWFDPSFADQRVPRLAEMLEVCRGGCKVLIELKYYGHDRALEQRVSDQVTAHEMDDQVMVMSLKPDAVKRMKALRPDLEVGLLLSVVAGDAGRLEADFLAVNTALATRHFINAAHARQQPVFAWTVNDVQTMIALLSRGIDGLITDRPGLARAVLAEWLSMDPAERLFLDIAATLGWLTHEDFAAGDPEDA